MSNLSKGNQRQIKNLLVSNIEPHMLSIYNNSARETVNNEVTVGQSLTFSLEYRYRIGSLTWDLGDGIRYYNRRSVNHTYQTSGTRQVRCIINDKKVIMKEIRVIVNKPTPIVVEEEVIEGIPLRVINQSNDNNNIDVVIFQKNIAVFDETAVAWQLLRFTGSGQIKELVFGNTLGIACQDGFGNFTPRLDANSGSKYEMVSSPSGDSLTLSGPSSSPSEIQLLNSINGHISGLIYRSNKLLARRDAVSVGQSAVFQFRPTIFIGVVSGLVEGQVMDSSVLSGINTEMSLLGIASTDIVMTGGGAGPSATPFSFSYQNITYA